MNEILLDCLDVLHQSCVLVVPPLLLLEPI